MKHDPRPSEPTVVIHDPTLRHFPGGFTAVPNRLLKCARISLGARMTYAMLLSYAWQENFCFPAQPRLAQDLGSSDRSVRTWLTELRAFGLITWKQQGLNRPNVYYLLKLPELPTEGEGDTVDPGAEDSSDPDWKQRRPLRSGRVFRSGPARPSAQDRKPASAYEDPRKKTHHTRVPSEEGDAATRLVRAFHRLCDHPAARTPSCKELVQAAALLERCGEEGALFVVRFAVRSAAESNFRMQRFGAVLGYADEALDQLEKVRRDDDRLRQGLGAERHDLAAYHRWRAAEISRRLPTLPPEELDRIRLEARSRGPRPGRSGSRVRPASDPWVRAEVDRELARRFQIPSFEDWSATRPAEIEAKAPREPSRPLDA